jgi:hypothetical protein
MSAAGRLWRRAPLWRLCLVSAIAATALAAMFPPPVPRWAHRGAGPGAGPDAGLGAGAQEAAPRYAPDIATAPPDYGVIESPPPGPGRSGIMPFSGRQVPLPAGTWQLLVLARGGGPLAMQVELLGRTDADRLTGLLFAAAPGPLGNAAGAAPDIARCTMRDAILHQTVPPDDSDPLSHECWNLLSVGMDADGPLAKTNEVLKRGLGRLHDMGIAVPDHMFALNDIRADPTGWLTVMLLLPDHGGEQQAASRKLQGWVRRFAPLLHKGFDGKLEPSDLKPSLSRDPG